ncbi:MAG: hypothetical protein ACHQX3_09190, partial [Nitrospirales bacterium]
KMNTLRDDILELDAVAGFENAQLGTITITNGNSTATATVSAMSARAIVVLLGTRSAETVNQNVLVTLEKTNSTTLTLTRIGTSGSVVGSYGIFDPRG